MSQGTIFGNGAYGLVGRSLRLDDALLRPPEISTIAGLLKETLVVVIGECGPHTQITRQQTEWLAGTWTSVLFRIARSAGAGIRAASMAPPDKRSEPT